MSTPHERLIVSRDRFKELSEAATAQIAEVERRLLTENINIEFDVDDGHGTVLVRWCRGTSGVWRFYVGGADGRPVSATEATLRVVVARRLSLDSCYMLAADAYDRATKRVLEALK